MDSSWFSVRHPLPSSPSPCQPASLQIGADAPSIRKSSQVVKKCWGTSGLYTADVASTYSRCFGTLQREHCPCPVCRCLTLRMVPVYLRYLGVRYAGIQPAFKYCRFRYSGYSGYCKHLGYLRVLDYVLFIHTPSTLSIRLLLVLPGPFLSNNVFSRFSSFFSKKNRKRRENSKKSQSSEINRGRAKYLERFAFQYFDFFFWAHRNTKNCSKRKSGK